MKIEIVLNKDCYGFDDLDWYLIQTLTNLHGGLSWVDGQGSWIDGETHQMIIDNNRYYTLYIDGEDYDDWMLDAIRYIARESNEDAILYVIDGKHYFMNERGN